MMSLLSGSMLAEGIFSIWPQGVLLVLLIILIVVFFKIRNRQG
ncbi:MAG: hypothetical protein AMXMBFR83_27060 [Phycisphaerae bacterium]